MLTIRQQLADARKAYHDLQTGKSARVVVDQNGERVEFTPANRTGLYNYIVQLEQKVGAGCGAPARPANGPAGFLF